MSMVEVDPKLFITCRLCLLDMGVYQILPFVQEQIKDCYDIDVEPFDGLPQLICKKCEAKLTEFHKLKQELNEKQKALKRDLECKNTKTSALLIPHQKEALTSSQRVDSETEQSTTIRRKSIEHITCKPLDLNSDSLAASTRKGNDAYKKRLSGRKHKWKQGYHKRHVCSLCSKTYIKRTALLKHLTYHGHLYLDYSNILNVPCEVKLEKIDNLPNMTGLDNTVVFDKNKILQNGQDSNYHIMYYLKNESSINNYEKNNTLNKNISRRRSSNSSEDFVFMTKIRSKRRRLVSEASNDTLVIGEKKESIPSDPEEDLNTQTNNVGFIPDSECINIDDSSDTSSLKSDTCLKEESNEANNVDYKTIQNIISMCHNKYVKKNDETLSEKSSVTNNSESHLKHKVLSIGRKLITKNGFNCIGLLRFLEFKNLDVLWIPNEKVSAKESNYVHINTKLRGSESYINTQWKSVKKEESDCNTDINELVIGTEAHSDKHKSQVANNEIENSRSKEIGVSRFPDGAELCITNFFMNSDNYAKNKLLNAHPVANPKQIPKKGSNSNTKANPNNPFTKHSILENLQSIPVTSSHTFLIDQGRTSKDIGLSMPIITSTTSLAPPRNEGKDESGKKNTIGNRPAASIIEKSLPRIKVKPVSELMPVVEQRATPSKYQTNFYLKNILTQTQNVTSHEGMSENITYPSSDSLGSVTFHGHGGSTSEAPREQFSVNHESVIMDTVELPNTKTKSPFEYFQKLLQIHNITFRYTNVNITPSHLSLIKFKLQFKQDSTRNCTVWLSLFYYNHGFFLNIKDLRQNDIDVNMLTPNWQWEVLKVYRGNIVTIVLTNAQKAGLDIYADTNKFLCLLKSINFTKIE